MISEELYKEIRSTGSHLPKLYGLAKVHKTGIPLRPVLSMPGSCYYSLSKKVADWISVIPESAIRSSTAQIVSDISNITLDSDEILTSFDVTALYTNVPVEDAILLVADKLYDSSDLQKPPCNKQTFIELARLATTNVLLQTHNSVYRQTDGLAMGTPPAMQLSNVWLSQFEPTIFKNSKLKHRYVDDILRTNKIKETNSILEQLNSMHPNLKFTVETENNSKLPFLDITISRDNENHLHSNWYRKPTDTGLLMNFHAIAPKQHKRAVVNGITHRVFNASSTWERFDDGLNQAKDILENNQFPPNFYNPIIENAINKLTTTVEPTERENKEPSVPPPVMLRIQHRGHATDKYVQKLRKLGAPITPVLTTRKLRTCLPTLKAKTPLMLRNRVVYQLTCPGCQSCYVGGTIQHLATRVQQHRRKGTPVKRHFDDCGIRIENKHAKILDSTIRKDDNVLWALEALYIRELHPTINTRDEFRSRELTLKF